MAKQDEWARITLRIPPELHEKLAESAKSSSMNAEIVNRLFLSFDEQEQRRADQAMNDAFTNQMVDAIVNGLSEVADSAAKKAVSGILEELEERGMLAVTRQKPPPKP